MFTKPLIYWPQNAFFVCSISLPKETFSDWLALHVTHKHMYIKYCFLNTSYEKMLPISIWTLPDEMNITSRCLWLCSSWILASFEKWSQRFLRVHIVQELRLDFYIRKHELHLSYVNYSSDTRDNEDTLMQSNSHLCKTAYFDWKWFNP